MPIKRIPLPTTAANRDERQRVYELFSTERIVENAHRFPRRPKPWSDMQIPIYISYNEERPRKDRNAQKGLCLSIIVVGRTGAKVRGAIIPILKKFWSVADDRRVNFWLKKRDGSSANRKDLEQLQKVLEDEIEPALIQQGIL